MGYENSKHKNEEQKDHIMQNAPIQSNWRFGTGVIIFIASWCSPLLIPLVATSDLSTRWKTLLSGALAAGIPEIGAILAIAIMGKSGFNTMKNRIFSFVKKYGPSDRVSLARYQDRAGHVYYTAAFRLVIALPAESDSAIWRTSKFIGYNRRSGIYQQPYRARRGFLGQSTLAIRSRCHRRAAGKNRIGEGLKLCHEEI